MAVAARAGRPRRKEIMSLLDWLLGAGPEAQAGTGVGDTETVRRIVGELESMEPKRARYLAAFAYVMGRVAHADLDISADETKKMEQIVGRLGHLSCDPECLRAHLGEPEDR